MFNEPGKQFAIYNTKTERIVRELDYIEAFNWAQDYEAGNSIFAVVERTVPKWSFWHTGAWRQSKGHR